MAISIYSLKDLKRLIESLSKSEKRHFSLFNATFVKSGNQSLYSKLYHSLLQEETELSNFIESESIKELTPIKNRLFYNILKSLRLYHQKKSINISIQNYLSDIETLYSLGLPKQGYYIFQKAYQQAVNHEKFALLLNLLDWEKKLFIVSDKPPRSITAIAAEEKKVVAQLTQLIELKNIFGRMRDLKKQYGQIIGNSSDELSKEIGKLAHKIKYEACNSHKARFYYNFTFTLFHWIVNNYREAYRYSRQLLNREIENILPDGYLDAILEHATSCIQIGQFTEGLAALKLAQNVASKQILEPVQKTKLFFYTIGYQLVIYNYMGHSEALKNTIHRAETEIKSHLVNMPREARHVLRANLMNAYIGINDIKKSEEIWEDLFQNTSKSVRRSIYDDLRLFRLFLLLQNKNYEIIPSLALSAYRYYSQPNNNPDYFKLEIDIASFLAKEHQYEEKKARNEVALMLKAMLIKHIAGFEYANNFQERYSFYLIWAEAILKEQPFCDAAANWYYQYAKK